MREREREREKEKEIDWLGVVEERGRERACVGGEEREERKRRDGP
jgi:hypothetical protein